MESTSVSQNMRQQANNHRGQFVRRWLREPLLHFLLAGGLLFGVYGLLNGDSAENAPGVVRITPAEVNWLKESWTRQWMRPPTEDEFRGLITGYLKEVLLAREAMEIGLDEDDTIIRRRLAQKMEFLVQDTLQQTEPSEAELRSFYEQEPERFQTPTRVSFNHIYFNRERRGENTIADARAALEQLMNTDSAYEPARFGDRFLGQYDFVAMDETAVAGSLGAAFASAVFAATPGSWIGPLESGYGLHVVHVTERQVAQRQDFSAVRDDVLTLLRQQRAQQGFDDYLTSLRKKYDVQVDEDIAAQVDPLAAAMEPAK